MLVIISATMAPELPCADRMAPRTRASTRSGPDSVAAAAMPSMVSRTLVPVSESATGKTFIASSAAAESPTMTAARLSQASNVAHSVAACDSTEPGTRNTLSIAGRTGPGGDSTLSGPFGYSCAVARTGMTNSDR